MLKKGQFMRMATITLLISLLFTCGAVEAAGNVEGPEVCAECRMDRAVFARSRALVTYTDRTVVGFCSLHCAAEELRRNRGRPVASLMVADHDTKELLDAKSAIWVMGGRERGVMTSPAKWAFGREKEATRFVREKGGEIVTFDRVWRAVNDEVEEMERMPELE